MKWKLNISFNPCTKIVLLFLCIVISSLITSLKYELVFVLIIAIFAILNGQVGLSIKGFLFYLMIYFSSILTVRYCDNSFRSLIMPFLGLVHKVYPVCMLSMLILRTTKVGEFLTAMNYIGVSKKISIPLAVMLRYIPTIKEDWIYIKDSMKLRGISPSFFGFLKEPLLTMECIYVPIIISASKAADELTIASVTRGIESPKKRTSIIEVKFSINDVIVLIGSIILTGMAIYMRYFYD